MTFENNQEIMDLTQQTAYSMEMGLSICYNDKAQYTDYGRRSLLLESKLVFDGKRILVTKLPVLMRDDCGGTWL